MGFGTICTGSFFIFICGNLFVYLFNGIGKFDFLHLSKLVTAKFFKHLSIISSNVVFRQVFYCYTVYSDRLLQLFQELNLQLDCSIAAIQKAVLVILTACVTSCNVCFLFFFFHSSSSSFTFVVVLAC